MTTQNDKQHTGGEFAALAGSAIWLIEKLWQDSMENELSAARGYSPEGYCTSEAEADAMITEGGILKANGWPLMRDTPLRRKLRVERLSLNDKVSDRATP